MSYQFTAFVAKAKEGNDWLSKELGGLRSGRAAPAVLDGIHAESYGTKMPIKHLASIGNEDARTLRVTPFDASLQKEIEKAIAAANLGLSVSSDERGVRVHFPELMAERRDGLLKVAKERLESARVGLRKLRDEHIRELEQKQKQGDISEDEKFRLKKDLEKLVEAENKKFLELYERKEREILA